MFGLLVLLLFQYPCQLKMHHFGAFSAYLNDIEPKFAPFWCKLIFLHHFGA